MGRLDPQWTAGLVDTGEEPCATSIQRQTRAFITEMIENASMTSRPLMGPRRQMDVLRTCQPSTQVHTAALSLDPQWMAVQVDTGEEPCATSIQRPTQPLITEMIENASMTTRWFGWLPQEIARLVMKFAWGMGGCVKLATCILSRMKPRRKKLLQWQGSRAHIIIERLGLS